MHNHSSTKLNNNYLTQKHLKHVTSKNVVDRPKPSLIKMPHYPKKHFRGSIAPNAVTKNDQANQYSKPAIVQLITRTGRPMMFYLI